MEPTSAPRSPLRILLCLPPAKVSHEVDTVRGVPDAEVRVVSSDDGLHPQVDIALPARRLPYLGHPDRWTAALAWLRGLSHTDPGAADVVVSQELYNPGSVQANRLARRIGVPHVVLVAEILVTSPLYRLPPWRQISRRIAGTADAFVCITETARRHALARGCPTDRTSVVHLGIDTNRFRPAAGGRVERPVVVFLGELRPDKGVLDLVSACERATARGVALRLVVVGDGPLRGELDQRAHRLPFLEVRGRVPRTEVPTLLRGARAVAVPSLTRPFWAEQFGFALVEAMASGLPVVTTRCGAIPEIVPDWNPLVDEGDIEQLAAGLIEALGPDGDDWGRANRDVATQRYDERRQGEAMGNALREVVERHRTPIG
jgi:glycosyltransferase involved in cell wall biosynthesis